MTRMKMAKLAAEHISLLVVLNVLQKEKIGMEKNGAMETVSGQMTNVKMQNWIHGGTLLQMKIQTSGIHMVVKNPASPPQLELTVLLVNILTSFTVMPLDSASTRRMFVMDIRIQAAAVMTKTLNVVWTNTSKEGLLRNMPLSDGWGSRKLLADASKILWSCGHFITRQKVLKVAKGVIKIE